MKKYLPFLTLSVLSFILALAQTPGATPRVNFRYAARVATQAVVSVRSDLALGSGVIISENGYIVTSFDIVKGAWRIQVILQDQRSFYATVVGLDQATGLALLKIIAGSLPFLHFAAPGSTEVGDVVLAVGQPYGLPATVTMGIICAKGRSIDGRPGGNGTGAFLQTDAVVNPDNCGGALVDLHGHLTAITARIASSAGPYAGYSFAIPAQIVKTTIHDLIRYGKVLHGDLGAAVSNLDTALAHRLGFSWPTGVYVDSLVPSGPAAKAGLRHGDVITSIDEYAVESAARFHELLARHNAGETISLAYAREGNIYRCYARLQWESHLARQDH